MLDSPKDEIEKQATALRSEAAAQGRRDATLWRMLLGVLPPIELARRVVAAGFLGTVAGESGESEHVKVGGHATIGTDCEDRVLRLQWGLAMSGCIDTAWRWVGAPPWHVQLVVCGVIVETMPAWALGGMVQ